MSSFTMNNLTMQKRIKESISDYVYYADPEVDLYYECHSMIFFFMQTMMKKMMKKSINEYISCEAEGDLDEGCYRLNNELSEIILINKVVAYDFYKTNGFQLIKWSDVSSDEGNDYNNFGIMKIKY